MDEESIIGTPQSLGPGVSNDAGWGGYGCPTHTKDGT